MKVLDLRCTHGHGFEGWFASNEAFETQLASGLVECPVCGEFVLHVRGALACPECRSILAESEERIGEIALPSAVQAG